MGIFSKLFGKKGKDESAEQPLEFKQAVDFNTRFFDLLKEDTFIARSDYKHLTQEYQSTATFFENGKRAQTLTYYCRQNIRTFGRQKQFGFEMPRCAKKNVNQILDLRSFYFPNGIL